MCGISNPARWGPPRRTFESSSGLLEHLEYTGGRVLSPDTPSARGVVDSQIERSFPRTRTGALSGATRAPFSAAKEKPATLERPPTVE